MNKDKIMLKCPLCYGEFQFGPHRYDGTAIPRYQITVCNSCHQSNWDGWAPHYEGHLIQHLKANNLPIPKRNAKGWFPRD